MLRKVISGEAPRSSNNLHQGSRNIYSTHHSINGASMFRKESNNQSNHPAFEQYKNRYELSNLIDDKKWTFNEFMNWCNKDLISENEAKVLIGDIQKEIAEKSGANDEEMSVRPRF